MTMLLGPWRLPTTQAMGLFECPVKTVASIYADLLREAQPYYTTVETYPRPATMADALQRLLPLTDTDVLRHLFIPLQPGWTAYLNNSKLGSDVGGFPKLMTGSV